MLLISSKVAPVKLDSGSTTTTDGVDFLHFAMHRREMELQPVQRRPRRVDLQQPLLHPAIEIEADRPHVADVLRRRLLELKADGALAAAAGGIEEAGGEGRLRRSGAARQQHAARPEIALAAEHVVKPVDPGRDPLGGRVVDQLQRGDRQHRDPAAIDQERILVGAVARAAVLDDAKPARRDLIVDAMVEQDDAVGDVLLEPLARQRVGAAFAGDDRGDAPLLEPGEQPAQLGAQHRRIAEAGKQRFDGVEDDAPRANRAQRMVQTNEEPFEVVFAGLLDLRALDADVFEREALPLRRDRTMSWPSEAAFVDDVFFGLFERDEDAGLAARRAVNQELEAEQGLATAGPATDQRRPAFGEPAAGDLIEAVDAGGDLGEAWKGGGSVGARRFRPARGLAAACGHLRRDTRPRTTGSAHGHPDGRMAGACTDRGTRSPRTGRSSHVGARPAAPFLGP